jgi:hypothetical protein
MNESKPTVVISTKSPGIAILLTIFLGPIGMLYSTILGAVVMFVVSVIVGFLTLGLGLLITWPVCILWAALAASGHNRRILAQR